MRKSLNTSTALIASLSLLAGGPAFPQESAPADIPMICADGSDQPCPEGVPLVPAPEAAQPAPGEVAPAPEAAVPEAAPADPAAAEAVTPAEPAGEAAPEAEAPEVQSDTGAPAEPLPPETAPEAAAPETTPAEAAPQAAPEPAPEAQPDEPAVTEPAPQAGDAPEAPAPQATEPQATEPQTTAPDAPATEAPADAAPAEPATDAGNAAGTETGDTAADAAPDQTPPALPVQPDAATGEAPVAAAAEAEAGTEPPADAQVSEEVVTEETARSSDEDFANPVSQPAAPSAAADDDDGLSRGEKAVLLGLGALAVGAILSNNRKVELNSGDRVVLERPDGSYQIIKDDNALLRQPGSTVRTERFADGSTRTVVTRADGSRIVTIRDAEYRVLRRAHVAPDGTETLLVDDTVAYRPVDVSRLPPPAPAIEVDPYADEAALRAALSRRADFDRAFSLAQVRDIEEVRALVPVIDLTAITFETGSAAIRPDQAEALSRLGTLMRSYIDADPREIFLIEGHTDAVGSAASNLALSDRRAESVALAMTEYFDVPPENLVVQGYGEEFLKVPTQGPERQNRRASVRRITDLLRQAAY